MKRTGSLRARTGYGSPIVVTGRGAARCARRQGVNHHAPAQWRHIMIKGLRTSSIWSENLNNLLPFYRDTLGLTALASLHVDRLESSGLVELEALLHRHRGA